MSSKSDSFAPAALSTLTSEIWPNHDNPINKAIQELWKSSKYTDVKIVNNKTVHHVHRSIICPQSGFFKRCLELPMREAEEGVIHLHDDAVDVTSAMLKSLYHNEYEYPPSAAAKPLVFDAEMYALAVKYEIPGLQHLAIKHFKNNAKTMLVEPPGLKLPLLDITWNEDFFAAVKIVYEGTMMYKDPLRLVAVDVVRQRAMLLAKHEWDVALRTWHALTAEHPELAVDVMCATTKALDAGQKVLKYEPVEKDVELVMAQGHATKAVATLALKASEGCIVSALMSLAL